MSAAIAPPALQPEVPSSRSNAVEYAAICSLSLSGAGNGLRYLREVTPAGGAPLEALRAWKGCLARLAGDDDAGCLEAVLATRPACDFARLNRVLGWLQRPDRDQQSSRRADLDRCLTASSPSQFARLVEVAWLVHEDACATAIARLRDLIDDWPFNDTAYAYLAELVGPSGPEFGAALVAALWLNSTNPLAHRLLPLAPPGLVTHSIVTYGDVALQGTPPRLATFLNLPLWRHDDMDLLGMPVSLLPLRLVIDCPFQPRLIAGSEPT